jgi:hypothetical protein
MLKNENIILDNNDQQLIDECIDLFNYKLGEYNHELHHIADDFIKSQQEKFNMLQTVVDSKTNKSEDINFGEEKSIYEKRDTLLFVDGNINQPVSLFEHFVPSSINDSDKMMNEFYNRLYLKDVHLLMECFDKNFKF